MLWVVGNYRPIRQLTVLKGWLSIWTLRSRPMWRQSAPIIFVGHGGVQGKRAVTSRSLLLVYICIVGCSMSGRPRVHT